MVLARIMMATLLAAGVAMAQAGEAAQQGADPAAEAGALLAPGAGRIVDGSQMQIGRYTTAGAQPAEAASDPLDVFVRIHYPRQTVSSVGDAVRHTLVRTGWRLVDPSALAPQAARFLALPLPESQRVLGPYRVRQLLQVLLGSTWRWHEDPATRQLWFTLASGLGQDTGKSGAAQAGPPDSEAAATGAAQSQEVR